VSSDTISNFTRLGYIPFWTDYTSYKAQLDFASLQLSDKHKKGMCRVTMLKGGFVDTSTTAGFKALPGVAEAMMQPSRFADMAEFVINMDKNVQIRTLSFDEGNISA
jgi:short-subunit dehydrogenase